MIKDGTPVGKKAIRIILEELATLTRELPLDIYESTIIDITDAVNHAYDEDYKTYNELFRSISGTMGMIVQTVSDEKVSMFEGTETRTKVNMMVGTVFSDRNINQQEDINIADLLTLYNLDITNYKMLSKCKFVKNRLYSKDQIDMIPSVKCSIDLR